MVNADVRLENVRVPVENRLVGSRTFADTSRCLTRSRQSIAWAALGHAVAAYECALTYVKQRKQFGQPLAGFQLIQEKLARMVADITSMQMMCVRLAQLEAEGRVGLEHAALAKLSTAEGARRVCSMARDMLGGNGILLDHLSPGTSRTWKRSTHLRRHRHRAGADHRAGHHGPAFV